MGWTAFLLIKRMDNHMHQLRVGIMGLGSIFHRVMTDLPNAAH